MERRCRRTRVIGILLGILVLCLSLINIGYSKEFCVSTAKELHTAFSEAATNFEDDVIKLVQGVYKGNFVYNSTSGDELVIKGGYTEDCKERVMDSSKTVLDGSLEDRVLFLNDANGSFVIEGITITNGSTSEEGGGLYVDRGNKVEITKCIVKSNHAYTGGGIYLANLKEVEIKDSEFLQNTAYNVGGMEIKGVSEVILGNNTIKENKAVGGYNANIGGGEITGCRDVYIENSTVEDNSAEWNVGGLQVSNNHNVVIARNQFKYNSAENDIGALNVEIPGDAEAYVENNFFGNNTAEHNIGGVRMRIGYRGKSIIFNNLFVHNHADNAYGVLLCDYADFIGSFFLINNSIVSNEANHLGGVGVIFSVGSIWNWPKLQFYMYNNILYNNTNGDFGKGAYVDDYVDCLIHNNLFTNPYGDATNISGDPKFVDPENGDFHLSSDSPCIDKGDNDAPHLPALDKDGKVRIADGNNDHIKVVDIGAYEYNSTYPPVINNLYASSSLGEAPFTVTFTCEATDKDGKIEKYKWDFNGDGVVDEITITPTVTHTFDDPEIGVYNVTCTVVDDWGATDTKEIKVYNLKGGLVAYWSFDSCNATDDSGHGHNGTIYGTLKCVEGISGKALEFNGNDSCITIPSDEELNLGGPFKEKTILLWFKASNNKMDDREVLYEEGGIDRGLNLYLDNDFLYFGGWNNLENGWAGSYIKNSFVPNKWYFVALVLDANEGVLKAYVNGELVSTKEGKTLYEHPAGIGIGCVWGDTQFHDRNVLIDKGYYFNGTLDEIRVYNRALSEEEIKYLYTQGIENFEAPKITSFTANVTTGEVPLEVEFICNATDPQGEALTYKWDFDGDGIVDKETDSGVVTYTYETSGTYNAICTVVNDADLSASKTVQINVKEANTQETTISENTSSTSPPQTSENTSNQTESSSNEENNNTGGGCCINPNAPFTVDLVMLFGVPGIYFVIRRKKK